MGFNNSPNVFAGSTIGPNRFVQIDTTADNRVVQAGLNAYAIGISQEGIDLPPGTAGADVNVAAYGPNANPFASNPYGDPVMIRSLGDYQRVRYGSTITRGDPLKSAADGTALTAVTGDIIVAYAFESGTISTLGHVQMMTPTKF